MTRLSQAPERTHRLIPSRFPPINTFEAVSSPRDLEAVLELEDWTNDRRVEARLRRLPKDEWVYGRVNASVVMAAFLHGAPQGTRFAGPDLGAWYASSEIETAALEVVTGIRREIALSALEQKTEELREYTARLDGEFVDIRGARPDLHDPDPASYPVSQAFGQSVRSGLHDGIVYDSVRHPSGANWVSYRPSQVRDVLQARHFRVVVPHSGRVVVDEMRTGS